MARRPFAVRAVLQAIKQAMRRAAATMLGARTSSYFSAGSLMYASRDRHTTFAEVYPPGAARLDALSGAKEMRAAAASGLAAGITVNVTGHDPLEEASKHGSSGGSSVLLESLIGGVGALVILLFVFGTLPAVLVPLAVAVAAILNTFTLVWALTYITDVSIIVQFLIALVGLGVAIDYALLMIFRFREELRQGEDVESALIETMTHAGRSVIVSGSTVAVAAVGMLIVAVLAGLGTQLNANEAQLKSFPGTGTAIAGRRMLADAHISPGVMKPLDVLVEHGGDAQQVAAARSTGPRAR